MTLVLLWVQLFAAGAGCVFMAFAWDEMGRAGQEAGMRVVLWFLLAAGAGLACVGLAGAAETVRVAVGEWWNGWKQRQRKRQRMSDTTEATGTTGLAVPARAGNDWLNNKAVLGALAALMAGGGWLAGHKAGPPAFDAAAYRRDHGLMLLGAEKAPNGIVWHLGTVGSNGPQEAFTFLVTAPPQFPPPVTQPNSMLVPAGPVPIPGTNSVK